MRPEQKPGGGDYKLQPHSYSIGDMAFQALMANPNTPQAILICGESGAGKTECCKFVLSYLIAKGSQQAAKAGKKAGGADSLTDQLLATSGPARGVHAPFEFPIANRFCVALLRGRAGRSTAENCGFRPGQNDPLEAFGNAKTVNNDNSSRFAKCMQLYFDKSGACGPLVFSQRVVGK